MLSIMEWCTSVINTRACRDTRQVHGRQSCGRRARPKATLQVTSVQRNHWARRLPHTCVLGGGAAAESARQDVRRRALVRNRRTARRAWLTDPHKATWHPPARALLPRRQTTPPRCPTRAASSRRSRRPASRRCPRRTTSRASSRRRHRPPRPSNRRRRRKGRCRCCSVRVRNTHCILTTATSPSARRRASAQT